MLTIENLNIKFAAKAEDQTQTETVVSIADLSIQKGEVLALLGESGSGKSLTSLAIMGLLPDNALLSKDSKIMFNGEEIGHLPEVFMRKLRGKKIAMIFQEPMTALNPIMTVGQQVAEVLWAHKFCSRREARQRVISLFKQVELKSPEALYHTYPHQLSGGMKQRVMIAMALACEPELLIADEPTSALDVIVQYEIISLLKKLQQEKGLSILFITHDISVVKRIADKVAVIYAGTLMETATREDLLNETLHPYTQSLLKCLPEFSNRDKPLQTMEGVARMQRSEIRGTADSAMNNTQEKIALELIFGKVYFPIKKGFLKRTVDHVKAVDGISFKLVKGKTTAIVGESGCGKTTLAKALLGLVPFTGGQVKFSENNLRRKKLFHKYIQIIFQDPFSSLNPRMLVEDIIAEGMRALKLGNRRQQQEKVAELIQQMGLPENSSLRYPHEFSGGQRQRICIARALAVEPEVIICDEPTSALDVSIQAQIINLLKKLQREKNLTYLFITHNMALVAYMADEIIVMQQGKIIEQGPAEEIIQRPKSDYTKALIAAAEL